jgi:hypothetical protein
MQRDPIAEQVRAARKEIEQQYPDAESYYRHLEEQQKAYESRLVRRRVKDSPHRHAL